jgi:hypothetical protein
MARSISPSTDEWESTNCEDWPTCRCSTSSQARPRIVPRSTSRAIKPNWRLTRTWSASRQRCRHRSPRAPAMKCLCTSIASCCRQTPPAAASKLPTVTREQLRATLGNVLSLQMIRANRATRHSNESDHDWQAIEGLARTWHRCRCQHATLDVDYWQEPCQPRQGQHGFRAGAACPSRSISRPDEVVLLGAWRYTDVTLTLSGRQSGVAGKLQSREGSAGGFVWDGEGAGKLKAQDSRSGAVPEKVSKRRSVQPGEALKESAGSRHRGRRLRRRRHPLRAPRRAGTQ